MDTITVTISSPSRRYVLMADSSVSELCGIAQSVVENSFSMSLDAETEKKLKRIARYLESVYTDERISYETLETAHDRAMRMLEQCLQASKTALKLLDQANEAVEHSKREEQNLLADLDFVHRQSNLPEEIRRNALGMLEKIREVLDIERLRRETMMDSIQRELNCRINGMKSCLQGPQKASTCAEASPRPSAKMGVSTEAASEIQ